MWTQDFPPKSLDSPLASEFGRDLARFLEFFLPPPDERTVVLKALFRYDFSQARFYAFICDG